MSNEFANVEGGFVKKEAVETLSDAEFEVLVRAAVNKEGLSALDVLHERANEYNKKRDDLLESVTKDHNQLQRAEDVEEDQGLLLAGLQSDSTALRRASEQLRADKKFILEAVSINGEALRFASEELQNDKEVVLAAMKQWPGALRYASDELRERMAKILKSD